MIDDNNEQEVTWIDMEDDIDSEEDVSFTEYDISASPNDFNIKTLFDFIDSGIVKNSRLSEKLCLGYQKSIKVD